MNTARPIREAKGFGRPRGTLVHSERGRGKSQQTPDSTCERRQHANTAGESHFRPVHIARTVIRSPPHVRQAVAPGPVFWLRTFARSPSHPGIRQDSGIRSVDGCVHYSGASASESHRLPYMMRGIARHHGQTAAQERSLWYCRQRCEASTHAAESSRAEYYDEITVKFELRSCGVQRHAALCTLATIRDDLAKL